MKCYNHNDRDAVATCMECGVGLCRECADKYESVLCDKCFEKKVQNEKIQRQYNLRVEILNFYLAVVIGIALVWICYFFMFPYDIEKRKTMFLMVPFFIPFAFKGIEKYFPGGGCLLMILKFAVGIHFGIYFYGWLMLCTCKNIWLNKSTNKNAILKILLFIFSNLAILVILFIIVDIAVVIKDPASI